MSQPLYKLFLSLGLMLCAHSAFSFEPVVIEKGDKDDQHARKTSDAPRIFALDFSNAVINSKHILETGIVVDEIPTLLDTRFKSLETALSTKEIKEEDYLLGVDVNGEVRYYPLSILNWHQGVNDTVNSTPIFVSWDPLTGQPFAIKRTLDKKETTFGVSGLVYRSSSLYYDRATQSLWSPALKTAITGTYSSYKPEEITSFITQAKAAKDLDKTTKVLSNNTGYTRDYHKNPYGTYGKDKTLLFPVRYFDASLPRKEFVLGARLTRGHRTKDVAFPLSSLLEWKKAKGIKFHLFSELFPGERPIEVTVHYMEPLGRFELSTPHDDVKIDLSYSYWFAWSAFHPETTVIRYLDNI